MYTGTYSSNSRRRETDYVCGGCCGCDDGDKDERGKAEENSVQNMTMPLCCDSL